jgi:CheY-like chemotaxis protein
MMDLTPIVVLIDTTQDEIQPQSSPESPGRSPSRGGSGIYTPDEDAFGLKLLQRILTESHLRSLSKLVVPILVLSSSTSSGIEVHTNAVISGPTNLLFSDRSIVRRCLDIGAADVLLSPFSLKSVLRLEAHAYRAYREAAKEQRALLEVRRGRKRSWVGVNEEKPFAYLREAMVSGLMGGICKLGTETEDRIGYAKVAVSHDRRADIAVAIGRWHFCAHDFNDDELIVAALTMFRHALSMPELERWRIPTGEYLVLPTSIVTPTSFLSFLNFLN